MRLEYSGTIGVGIDDAWATLSDLRTVVGGLPGIQVTSVDPAADGRDRVVGTVTVPLGPLTMSYRGEATFTERDEAAKHVVIAASGRDASGGMPLAATVDARLQAQGAATTQVTVQADVDVPFAAGPFGFVVAEAGNAALRQFVSVLGRRAASRDKAGDTGAKPGDSKAGDTGAEPVGAEPDEAAAVAEEWAAASEAGENAATTADARTDAESEATVTGAWAAGEGDRPSSVDTPLSSLDELIGAGLRIAGRTATMAAKRPAAAGRWRVWTDRGDQIYPFPARHRSRYRRYAVVAGTAFAAGAAIGWLARRR